MEIVERSGDLFTCKDADAFMQCISADFACGAGIAVQFNRRFFVRNELFSIMDGTRGLTWWDEKSHGFALLTGLQGLSSTKTINLVTKKYYYQKPTIDSLKRALYGAKQLCSAYGIHTIAMPMIASGLDRLNFDKNVLPTLRQVFADTNTVFLIYRR